MLLRLAASSLSLLATLHAEPARASARPPTCVEDLDGMRAKIEADYAGFLLEVRPHGARFDSAYARIRTTAERTSGDACWFVLDELARWFDDPHLFVYQSQRLDSVESRRREANVRRIDLDETRAVAALRRRANSLDPIEGIWYDGALRVAVVPDPAATRERFIAVVVRSDTSTWPIGSVRATIVRRADGRYDIDHALANYAERHVGGARIAKGVLLRLDPGMWGRAFPLAPGDSGLLDPVDPHRATIVTRRGAIVVSVPSHDPSYRAAFDSLITANASRLRSADRLILDLRGNEGGSSGTTDALMPYFASAGQPPLALPRYRNSLMLASDDQMAYVRIAFGADTIPRVARLLERMRAHMGELVPQFDSLMAWPPDDADSVIIGPRRVGVLIDHQTVSASEVATLEAKRSRRVTVFGEPTAGALDYQSVNIVDIRPDEHRWFLGYPTITASAELPRGGMRGNGIAPDVRMNVARGSATIDAVAGALRTAPERIRR